MNASLYTWISHEIPWAVLQGSQPAQDHILFSYSFHGAIGVVLVLVALWFQSAPVTYPKVKPQLPSPPCERVIEQAERTNRLNGHENAGFLSREAGFSPLQKSIAAFPASHAIWDQIAADLPRLIQGQVLRETVNRMPLLDASADALPDIYLQRAATVLGLMSHAYVRMDGTEPLALKYGSHSEILPPGLEIPWTQVCRRLGRPSALLSYIDDVVYNFTSTSPTHCDVTVENLKLVIPTFGNIEERTFIGVMIEINALTIPVLQQVIEAQRSVLAKDPSSLKLALRTLLPLLRKISRSLHKIHANGARAGSIDPVIWSVTIANLAIPWIKDAIGASGTAHPFFHMMDEFIGRSEYKSGIGKDALAVRATYPIHWRQFLEAIAEVSVGKYVSESKDCLLIDLWGNLTSSYQGHDGLLGVHRRKAFGFLAVSFRVGRNITINGLRRKGCIEPWLEANQEIEKARLERRCADMTTDLPETKPRSSKLFMSSVIRHNTKEHGYWFSAKGHVYDASAFMGNHPGGDTVIALGSGQDATADLEAAAHFTNLAIRNKLETYRIGTVEKPKFSSPQVERLYIAALELGEKAAGLENISRMNFRLLYGKVTGLDEPGVLTAQKARHLHNVKARLRHQHVPMLLLLLEAALVAFDKLGTKQDLSAVRTRMASVCPPEKDDLSGPEESTANGSRTFAMAESTLEEDLRRASQAKEHIAVVLELLEDPGFTPSDQGIVAHLVEMLSKVADQLVLAAN